jgi:hypothetical protein
MPDPWQERFARYGFGVAEPPPPTVLLGPPARPDAEIDYRDRRYAEGALRSEAAELATTADHRNDRLNIAALKLAGYVNSGALDENEVIDALTEAGRMASVLGDHPFTDIEIRNTLASGLGAGRAKGLRKGPPDDGQVQEVDAATINGHKRSQTRQSGTELTEAEKEDLHRIAVRRRAYDLRVADEARALWTAQRATLSGQQPPPMVSLTDMLAVPDEPARYRLDDLWPVGGRVLLAAQYKAGKTSLVANLIRSLIDGDAFLGRWAPHRIERLVLMDTELDERMLRSWLRDQNIRNTNAINVISMRGRLSTFNLTDDTIRADWAQRIAGAELVLLDCLRPCLDSLGLSEANEAGRFLIAFDALCTEAGATEALVVHHMGHGQERSRGDSRLLDWPDVLWKIVRDTDDEGEAIEDGDRFFSAMGRDVNVQECQLDWTPETRSLMVCGGGRSERRARDAKVDIAEILSDPRYLNGLSKNQLVGKLKALGHSRDGARRAVDLAVVDSVVLTTDGPYGARLHVLNPSERP